MRFPSISFHSHHCLALRSIIFPAIFIACSLLTPAVAYSASIEGVRMWRAPDNTRLVFDLSASADHQIFELSSPDRLVIDMAPADFEASLANLALENTPVKRIRTGTRDDGGLRVVLDLRSDIKPRSFSLKPNANYGHRLVVDLYDAEKTVETSIDDVVEQDRDIVIAIDAGHGGEDPGASGPGNIREKNIVMDISRKLASMIDSRSGYRAVLVRSDDYFVSLSDRPLRARAQRADFFVSIHADAFRMASVHGASVYALSGKGATSESAKYIADRENRSDLIGGVSDLNLRDKDDQLATVLLELSMNATLDSSLRAGEMVLAEMGQITKLHKRSVEQAGFVVLKSPDMPSLLIETGFISNPDEARRLSNSNFQDKMARAIFNGVQNYFSNYPPAGTLIASRSGLDPEVYVIKRGDTLSGIADRYNVSLGSSKAVNRIDSSVIRVGQTLEIPTT